MATEYVIADNADGYIYGISTSSWSAARDATSGSYDGLGVPNYGKKCRIYLSI